MNVIYNCSNDALLPILMEKLFLCQLSIPLIFPDSLTNVTTVQLWSLRGIVPDFISENSEQTSRSLVDIPHPFMCFARIGDLKFSKSRMLNSLLRLTHHDTFFHRDCKHGNLKRVLSNGTVEAAWFQPSAKKSSEYQNMFCILNLRGESTENLNEAEFMCKIASLNFLMLDTSILKNRVYEKYVMRCKTIKSTCVLCFITGSLADVDIEDLKRCMEYFKVNFRNIVIRSNWQGTRIMNMDEWKEVIKDVIIKHASGLESRTLNDDVIRNVRDTNYFCLDEDDLQCQTASQKTQILHELLSRIKPTERKLKMLPLQGELWRNWCTVQQDLYRNRIASENMEVFMSEKAFEKQAIRQCQFESLLSIPSQFFLNICSVLTEAEYTKEIFIFLAWMKIILNDCSIEILPNLRNKFVDAKNRFNRLRRLSTDDDSYEECQKEVQDLGDQLCNSSFGLEHIFREVGQAFESIVESSGSATIKTELFLKLPQLMARLVLDGMPLELLDGDTAFPLMTWIKAVFDEIQNIIGENKRIFVISVLGIQSSGESTLLNTMFGLQFSVSAGRCTRGAFCQLIPVEAEYARKLGYDYILVIDTEGLRAPELIDTNKTHDNELATFVVGLANLTIVNINGENFTEMQNVLEIVIHAMLRIKFVTSAMEQLNPSCIFIHHNVGTATAHDRLRIGETNLLTVLDRVTKSAAEHEKKLHIKSFKDIINYDDETLSMYLPDLWQGDPPMAPVNYGYSEQVFKIKELLINKISKTSVPITVNQFTNRMKQLWESILYEDFIFTFRNGEEVKAYLHLDEYCSQLLWSLNSKTMSLQENFTTKIIERGNDVHEFLEPELRGKLSDINQQLQIELKNYFETSVNKYVIEQWRPRYSKYIEDTCTDAKNKIMETMHRYSNLRSKQVHDKLRFEKFIINGVEQTVKELKINPSKISEEDLSSYFDGKWQQWISSFFPWSNMEEAKQIVYGAIDAELRNMFHQHHALLLCELDIRSSWNSEDCNFEKYLDVLNYDRGGKNRSIYEIMKNTFRLKGKVHEQRCLKFIQDSCNRLFNKVKRYVKDLVELDFQIGHATQVMRMIKDDFTNAEEEGKPLDFTFPVQLRIRIAVYITSCAAKEFIKLRNRFMERTIPSADILNFKSIALDKLRCEYYGSALRTYDHIDQLKQGIKAVANVVFLLD